MTTSNGSSSCVVPIQLTLCSYIVDRMDKDCINKVRSSSTITTSTHLNIAYEKPLHGLLIEIIGVLPNLYSLEIEKMARLENNLLSSEAAQMFSEVAMNNKIAKVKLHEMNEMQQIYFLLDLCSQMQYFEVDCKTENDVINLVTFIIRNSVKHMQYLRCLCIFVPNLDEKLIETLKIIFDLERPFHPEEICKDYRIHRIENKIFIDWKA